MDWGGGGSLLGCSALSVHCVFWFLLSWLEILITVHASWEAMYWTDSYESPCSIGQWWVSPESMIIHREPAFSHSLLPHPSRQQVVSLSQSFCVSPVELNYWRGGRSQIIRRRESLVFCKSFNTLWVSFTTPLCWKSLVDVQYMNLGIFSKARNFAHSNIEIEREEACPSVVVVFAQVKKKKYPLDFPITS